MAAAALACSKAPPTTTPDEPSSQPSSLPTDHSVSTSPIDLEALFAPPKGLPEVVAKVEEVPVPRDELIHELRQLQVQLTAAGLPDRLTRDEVLTSALSRAVDRHLERLLAEDLGVEAEERAVAAWLENIEGRMKADPAFAAFLLRAGKDETQRALDARREALMGAITSALRSRAQETLAAEARDYYDRHPQDYVERAGTEVWRAFVKAPRGIPQRDRDAARARAEGLRKAAKKDPNQFENLAIARSDGGKAAEGGYLGYVPEGALPEKLYAQVRKAKPGSILPLWEDAAGFAVHRVGKSREERVVPFEEAQETILDRVFGPVMQKEIDAAMKKLRAEKAVVVLAEGLTYKP